MYKLKVENNRGDILEFTNNSNYNVYNIEGLNPPQAIVNTSVNTTTDGSSINSVRVGNRNIVIYVTIEGDVETNRINLYKYFPLKKTIKIYFSNNKRDVYIEGIVEQIECNLFTTKQVAQISLICPKPYFKSVNELISYFSNISSLFQFPFSISKTGVELSAITTNIRKSIVNTGDVETGVILKLFARGTVVNPIIYDVLKRKQIKLNFTMKTSDMIVINTNIGEKTVELVRDGVTTNAMGYLAQDSSWFTLEAGDNVFTYNSDSGNSNLQITFSTPILYSGV